MPVLLTVMILWLASPFPALAGDVASVSRPVERTGREPDVTCSSGSLLGVANEVVAAWNDADGQRLAWLMLIPEGGRTGWLAFSEPGTTSQFQPVDHVPALIDGRAGEDDRLTVLVESLTVEPLGDPAWGLYGEVPVGRAIAGRSVGPHSLLLFMDCASGRLDGIALRPPGHIVRSTPAVKRITSCTEALASAPFEQLVTAINAGEGRTIRTLVATRAEAESVPVYRRFAFDLPDTADHEPLLFADIMDPVPALAAWAERGRRLELLVYAWDIDRQIDDTAQVWATFEGIYRDGSGVAHAMNGKVGVDCTDGRVNALDLIAA